MAMNLGETITIDEILDTLHSAIGAIETPEPSLKKTPCTKLSFKQLSARIVGQHTVTEVK